MDNLEDELNELSGNKTVEQKEESGNIFSGYFGSNSTPSIVKEDTSAQNELPLDDLNEANLGKLHQV